MEPEICASIKVKRKSSKKNFSVLKMKFLSRGAFQHPSYSLVFCCQVATTVIIIWNQRTFMSYKCRFSHCYHKQIKPFLLFLRAVAVSRLITSYSHFFTPAAVRLPLNRVDLTNRFLVPSVCSIIDHRWSQNMVTKKWHTRRSRVYHLCSYHVLTSSVIYYWEINI